MRSLFTFFTKRHLLANVLTVALIILGTRSLLTINREEFPNIISGLVSVNTIYRGASPEDVELNVTNKIEDSLKDVSDISSFDSTSMENKSTVSIEIEEGADEDKVYNDIIDAVNRVSDLPVDAEQPVIAMRTPNRVAMSIGISSKVFSYKDLRKYARSIEKKIMDLPLVGSITLSGSRDREIRIEVSLDKMVGFGVSLNEIKNAINSRNIRSSGGSLESYTDQKNVITLSRFTTPGEVKNVIIKSNSEGSIIYLKDVADIYDDFVTQTELYRVNGVSTITMEIGKKDSADIIRAADSIKKL
ncbi:efflux RND transporter permease subunit, partial [bacterium]|nr:efflux RND transporter permease subunit [bacterium]